MNLMNSALMLMQANYFCNRPVAISILPNNYKPALVWSGVWFLFIMEHMHS
jgi:hypothetical protein